MSDITLPQPKWFSSIKYGISDGSIMGPVPQSLNPVMCPVPQSLAQTQCNTTESHQSNTKFVMPKPNQHHGEQRERLLVKV